MYELGYLMEVIKRNIYVLTVVLVAMIGKVCSLQGRLKAPSDSIL